LLGWIVVITEPDLALGYQTSARPPQRQLLVVFFCASMYEKTPAQIEFEKEYAK
jgi:hypothetical protein